MLIRETIIVTGMLILMRLFHLFITITTVLEYSSSALTCT